MEDYLSQLKTTDILQMILSVVLIVILTLVLLYLVRVGASAIDKRFIRTVEDPNRRARLQTLRNATKSTLQIAIITIAVLIALGTLGIDIGPALAAAGILGLAVSLGAQTIIKDFIGGMTILLEDEYRVGDRVRIGTVTGDVEAITLRRTDVRDAEGRLFIFPNGEVRVVANETRDWARALIELHFAIDIEHEKPLAALKKALARLSDDVQVKPFLMAEPEIFGWNQIVGSTVVIRSSVKVVAGKQDEIARLMRQYALEALREAGIEEKSISG
jgi:small conductance mechanosensitive channel